MSANYDKAWKALAVSDCFRTFFLTKSAAKQVVFKEHVRTFNISQFPVM